MNKLYNYVNQIRNPYNIEILEIIGKEKLNVNQIWQKTRGKNITYHSTVSLRLSNLKDIGVVDYEKKSKEHYYFIVKDWKKINEDLNKIISDEKNRLQI